VGEQATKLVTARLFLISIVVPEKPLAKLRGVTIQLDLNARGASWHAISSSAGWLKDHGYSEQLPNAFILPMAAIFFPPTKTTASPGTCFTNGAWYHDQVARV